MWFDESVHEAWLEAVRSAIEDAGYKAIRIDKIEHNNRIDDEIVAAIRSCNFLVADFTGQRGGVYFEAGFAQGLGKQVIWLCREDELSNVHFDTRQYNYIKWQPSELHQLRIALRNRITATIGKGTFPKAV
jgi:nucleoside 2-deoxyribosyltransferase